MKTNLVRVKKTEFCDIGIRLTLITSHVIAEVYSIHLYVSGAVFDLQCLKASMLNLSGNSIVLENSSSE